MFVTRGIECTRIPAGIPESRIPDQINLALEWFNSNVCSAELAEFRGIPRIPKNEAQQEREYKTECTS